MNSEKENNCDVLIVGGGLVGASLACMLEDTGLSISIIEVHPLHADTQPCYDDRTVALSYGSRLILETMGLWNVLADKVEAIKTIHISDRGHFGVTRLRHDEEGVEALGYVAENRVLGEVLYQRLDANKKIHLHCPANLISLEQKKDHVHVCYQEGDQKNNRQKKIKAKLLVAADGVTSQVRELLQIGVSKKNYRQSAVITNITPGKNHQNIAYERFTESGPLAFLPMTDNRCSVVWTVPSEQAEVLAQLDDAEFIKQLQERFGYRLGQLKRAGQRSVYPLALVETTQVVRGRVVVVGNAAHALHPVAGQGFNLALRDIALLAELISTTKDAGDETLLQTYQETRKRDVQRVYRFTDTLVRIFSNNILPLAHARSAGLFAADLMPFVKHQLAKQSMGLSGHLSRLSRRMPIGTAHD